MSQSTITIGRQEALPHHLPLAKARPATGKSFVGHAKLIGGLTLVSRVMGLAREIVAGHYLGTGLVASAFTVAFTIPNLFRKLFGEGALAAAFIPLYAQAVKKEQSEGSAAHSRPLEPNRQTRLQRRASIFCASSSLH